MKIIRTIFACFLAITCLSSCHADALDYFVATMEDQQIAADWIMENKQKKIKLDDAKALAIAKVVYAYSSDRELDPLTVLAMIKQESGFNPKARSFYDARGLMQVVPRYHRDKLNGRDPYIPQVSIEVGTQILSDCIAQSPNNKRKYFKCYSGGARNYHVKVDKYRTKLVKYVAEAKKARTLLLATSN